MYEEASQELLDAIAAFQGRLSTRIAIIASSIETDSSGNISSTPENIARVGELVARMKAEFIDEEFADAVNAYVDSLDSVTADVIRLFDEFTGIDEGVLNAIRDRYKNETATYLTDPNSYENSIWKPVTNSIILGTAIGALLGDTVESVVNVTTEATASADVEAVTVSAPLMLQRTETAAAAEQTGAKFFLFQGRPIKTTRPWCREREGKYWHIEEIKEWGRKAASGDGWDGMVEGTNEQTIFVHLGGWFGERNSCRHLLIPQLQFAVPEEDLARMREKGLL
jgi:hypothetical protein